jgi:transcription initiation factor TFIIIB Brf1 subunit/transcription initiation factor TFIIB
MLRLHVIDNNNFHQSYEDWGHIVTRNDQKSISSDLVTYNFPDEIVNQADLIYNQMKYQARRLKVRTQLLFYCVYCAHLELGRNIDPINLGSRFNLTPSDVQKCDSMFSPLQTGYYPPRNSVSPAKYLPEYCDQIKLSEDAAQQVISMTENILQRDRSLLQENPQTVAAGFLQYYVTINGINLSHPDIIANIVHRSKVTVDNMMKRIANIDNA